MRRPDLNPDCGSCAALCCVATSFEASEDFALDKPMGQPCPNLRADCRCAIHGELVERGFRGCALFDCHGAGPRVTRAFAGLRDAEAERQVAFLHVRELHELLWMLTEAAQLGRGLRGELSVELSREIEALDALARGPAASLVELDLRKHRRAAHALLRRVGQALGGRGQLVCR
jgi:hypothetical protein